MKDTISMEQTRTWKEILDFVADITPYLSVTALLYKLIDKVSSYYSAQQDAKLREIVKDEMEPQISNLSDKIEDLSKAIWALKNKP